MTQEGLRLLEEQLGYREPRTGMALATEPVRDIVEGAAFEAGGRANCWPCFRGRRSRRVLSLVGWSIADMRQIPEQRPLPLPVLRR